MKDRIHWIDITKGIGILCVVLGHSQNSAAHHYLFWFHMPLFFILSGILYKEVEGFEGLKSLIVKRFKQLIIPYISFGILITFIDILLHQNFSLLYKDIIKLFYGGQLLGGLFGVFWFIPILFLTQIVFAYLQLTFSNKQIVLIISLLYIFAHFWIKFDTIHNFNFPWNIDVLPMSIFYYGFAHVFVKKILKFLDVKSFILLFLSAMVVILLDYYNLLTYNLDMKTQDYNHLILDIIVPFIFTILIINFSKILKVIPIQNFLVYIGSISMTIMYLHIPINKVINNFIEYNNMLIFLTCSILFSVLYHEITRTSKLAKFLFKS